MVVLAASTACRDICYGDRTYGRRVVSHESFFFVRVFQKLEVDAFGAEYAFFEAAERCADALDCL